MLLKSHREHKLYVYTNTCDSVSTKVLLLPLWQFPIAIGIGGRSPAILPKFYNELRDYMPAKLMITNYSAIFTKKERNRFLH